jgi:hypothetical protein
MEERGAGGVSEPKPRSPSQRALAFGIQGEAAGARPSPRRDCVRPGGRGGAARGVVRLGASALRRRRVARWPE